MSEPREWKWMVGILHGIGEAFWEESGGKIRHISRLITDGNNIGLRKAIIGGVMVGVEEIAADGMVAFSVGATDEQQKNCITLWSSLIRPINGAARFTLEK